MTYDVYRYIFIVGAILCGVMLLVTVIIFFLYNIPKVISDLSGATARKAINDIRRQNEEGGEKTYKPSAVNAARGKVTDKISRSGRIVQNNHVHVGIDTVSMQTQQLENTSAETTLLDENGTETTLLENNFGETSLLDESIGQTGKLSQASEPDAVFAIEYEITYVHTNELIPEV